MCFVSCQIRSMEAPICQAIVTNRSNSQRRKMIATATIAACAKHFAGYGDAESGRDYATTNIPENELRNVHMRPFKAAVDAGVNFFDNAEVYAGGEAERLMGEALRQFGWPRHSYLISTKFFWGIHDGPNTRNTLNRKYLMEAIDQSLERLQLDHVDLVYCHRPDPDTPIEETVWAMSDIVASGRALYWGTSEWSADEIRAAWGIADRLGLGLAAVFLLAIVSFVFRYSLIASEEQEIEGLDIVLHEERGYDIH